MSKIFSISFAALTALAISTPSVTAHNNAKYTNVPFVVAASCANIDPGVSARFVTTGGVTKLQLYANNYGESGAFIFASSPGTPGRSSNIAPTPTSTFPEGVITFNVSGLPSGGVVESYVQYADGSSSLGLAASVNGIATIYANAPTITPGSPVTYADFAVLTGTSGLFATVTCSNFLFNNQPLLLDTSLSLTQCVVP